MSLFSLIFLGLAVTGAAGCFIMADPPRRLWGLAAPVGWGLGQWAGQVLFPTGPVHFLAGLGLQGVAGFLGVWLYQMARVQRMRRVANEA
ncbi:MAG: hypothetical protein KC549_13885 [Myxococcales bacterium]|nr:hypothetical protein [Myxococcales bacterium]MCB9549245.1 hypothetical protein [Myxococcales bacterium]